MDFNQLYTAHYKNVLGTARSYLRNHGDAEDAAQDTFLEAYESMDTYDKSYAISTWLNRICANKCRDKLRRRKLEAKSFVIVNEGNDHLLDSQEDYSSPDKVIEAEERGYALINTFLSMPNYIREALTLRLIEQKSYKDIAEEMSTPLGTVKTWVRRGRSQLS